MIIFCPNCDEEQQIINGICIVCGSEVEEQEEKEVDDEDLEFTEFDEDELY